MLHLNNNNNKKNQTKNTNPTISRRLPPHSALSIRGKTNIKTLSTNLTLYEAYTNHWINLRRAGTKRKKEFNLLQGINSTFLETWEKETSNTVT